MKALQQECTYHVSELTINLPWGPKAGGAGDLSPVNSGSNWYGSSWSMIIICEQKWNKHQKKFRHTIKNRANLTIQSVNYVVYIS